MRPFHFRQVAALAAALAALAFLPCVASAQGGDPFSAGVQWFIGGPARGVAMFAVAAVAVMLWFLMRSLAIPGLVLGGGLILANAQTIVGWMGF